ncbi:MULTISPECIES: ABC transporter ATP-binding protein [Nostocales]|uniref:ABC transporter n=3 Tax=Nostocales TaxID=1161 RepID=A0A0C1NCC0_9CYAN|nr:ABC transporter ATP-binding protein [Tolypothrix bouteillei]KAF3886350.1 ABC transporter ATP-binding protein [Tolypothrix bouteillei VB521301]
MIIYDIKNVVKTYPGQTQPANKNISLQISEAEIFGILGDNGAGKSTLVRQMVNLLASDSGSISLLGKNIVEAPYLVQMNVGYMPQESGALNNLTVGEALYFTSHLRGLSRADAQKECNYLLDLWQIRELRHKPSSRLSGGQRRLLRLAVAMAGLPPVLILDEPTNDLDPQRRKLVWDNLRQINQEQGTTIILITHDAIEAEKAIQRVGIMRAGELVAVGRPSELKQQVDRILRLELFFSPDSPPELPPSLTYIPLEPGHWQVLLEWAQVTSTLNSLNLDKIDDFRLYSATLEDLYLHYATQA